ncbi:MAG: SPOR domain-containing protein [Planctomycetota bacterium]
MPHCVLLTIAALGLGCESTPHASPASMRADYDAGRYEQAHEQGVELARRSRGTARDEAQYVAGLSAYRTGDLYDAELRLASAARSEDPATAAHAKASLGLVLLDRDRPREAAAVLREAAADLDGEDRARALRFANDARRRADAAGLPAAGAPAFTLQVGAFRERRRARRAADDASRRAADAGLATARIIERDARGGSLYLVQVGTFGSRREAARARGQLGRLDYIVAAVGN